MELEYAGFKDIIAKKDEWIIKQGNEMRVIVDQLNAMPRRNIRITNRKLKQVLIP
jgi:hypothetical protein